MRESIFTENFSGVLEQVDKKRLECAVKRFKNRFFLKTFSETFTLYNIVTSFYLAKRPTIV